ncbi:response regulator [Phytoactinopolyspora halotolerans]|uniref:Response regulator transcription factor n=1 Tax=Phytoactinopolyspora halotolerans TaxID=1981512 RepID=A0A6L9S6Q0_9ACTN|nr:response regulator transcription factor [Phytoactinopolyspora halotolerans]NEE00441.1 response regulator transcription factor [Phytoactinopolyspora halotolerans]
MRGPTVSASDTETIGVFVVDDHAVVRRGVTAYLEILDDVTVVGEAGNGREALERLDSLTVLGLPMPRVVLMDLMMPEMDGVAATAEILRRYPTMRVVVLTGFGEVERVNVALENGAAGYLLKDAGPAEVVEAIHAAARDEVFLDAAVARQLAQQMRKPNTGVGGLTNRERDVLVLIAQGKSNREIADQLVISERTARTHVSNLLGKLGLRSRTQAVLLAIREGLVNPAS